MKLLSIHTIRFLLIFVISHSAIVSKGEQCSASLPTVRVVQTCPQNEAELSRAQQQKKCEHLAKYQKCTKPATFKYHCVLNAFSNETIEVCAQEIYSQGYCVKFDEGSLLQMFGEDCTTYSNPCATRFLSSDLLQYLKCNDLIQKGMDSIKTTATPNHHYEPTRTTTTPNPQNETNIGEILGMIFGFSGALLAMVLVCVVFSVVKLCRFCKSTEGMKSKSLEAMALPIEEKIMTETATFKGSSKSFDEMMAAEQLYLQPTITMKMVDIPMDGEPM